MNPQIDPLELPPDHVENLGHDPYDQLCDDCGVLIERHAGTAWRNKAHRIRCHLCALEMRLNHGYDNYESYYVC